MSALDSFLKANIMNIVKKVKTAFQILKDEGRHGISSILANQYQWPIFINSRCRWERGTKSEIAFWDSYFRTKGLKRTNSYENLLNPELYLQKRPAALLPPQSVVNILDVGAGPLTCLGKKCEGKTLHITAVDPLADEYDRLLDKYQIIPLVRTQKLYAENLSERFRPSTFDLVYARNCIDHSCNPEKAIQQMLQVVKKGMYVLLEHEQNEAERTHYEGLHQWNLSMSPNGDFVIKSKALQTNVTIKYKKECNIVCSISGKGKGNGWLVTTMQKK